MHPSQPPDFLVFTGNANPALAAEIARNLDISLGAADVGRFSDGEVTVELKQNVRARDIFVVQPTCAPTNDNLMELLVMVDALKRASVERICAVIPYFGYARQDRRPRSTRVPISAKVVVTILIVTHNMQQAARVSDFTAFMYLGELVEVDATSKIFTNPAKKATEDYITGRYG